MKQRKVIVVVFVSLLILSVGFVLSKGLTEYMYVHHNTLHDTTKEVYNQCHDFICGDPLAQYHTYSDINGQVFEEYFIPFQNVVLRSPASIFTRQTRGLAGFDSQCWYTEIKSKSTVTYYESDDSRDAIFDCCAIRKNLGYALSPDEVCI